MEKHTVVGALSNDDEIKAFVSTLETNRHCRDVRLTFEGSFN